jgi:hypothetical protein
MTTNSPAWLVRRLAPAGLLALASLVLRPVVSCASAQTPTDIDDPLSLPFTVSYYFTPTGAYGDAATPGLVTTTSDCPDRAPAPADGTPQGDCYFITYGAPAQGFGGVFWQFPPNNWGTSQGRMVSPGATQVTFYAKTDYAPLNVSFKIGGINDPTPTASLPYADGIDDGQTFAISSEWKQYSIPVTGTYSWVLGAFEWEITTRDPVDLYIDTLVWQ